MILHSSEHLWTGTESLLWDCFEHKFYRKLCGGVGAAYILEFTYLIQIPTLPATYSCILRLMTSDQHQEETDPNIVELLSAINDNKKWEEYKTEKVPII